MNYIDFLAIFVYALKRLKSAVWASQCKFSVKHIICLCLLFSFFWHQFFLCINSSLFSVDSQISDFDLCKLLKSGKRFLEVKLSQISIFFSSAFKLYFPFFLKICLLNFVGADPDTFLFVLSGPVLSYWLCLESTCERYYSLFL